MTGYKTVDLGGGLSISFPTSIPTEDRVAELSAAFDRVKNPNHWKDVIDTEVTVSDPSELVDIFEAVEFYTATNASAVHLGNNRFRVTAPGYWRGPAN